MHVIQRPFIECPMFGCHKLVSANHEKFKLLFAGNVFFSCDDYKMFRSSKRAGPQTNKNSFDKLTLKFSAFMRAFIALKEALRLPNISGSIV